jgi:hypothetical protein
MMVRIKSSCFVAASAVKAVYLELNDTVVEMDCGKKWYAPDRDFLRIVGDIDAELGGE